MGESRTLEPGGDAALTAGDRPAAGAGAAAAPARAASFGLRSFLGYPVDRILSSAGGEADIYVIRDGAGREYVLRLFRQGREPKPEVFGRLADLSERLGGMICRTYRTGLDEGTGRWYEIQEYFPLGDLAGFFARGPLAPGLLRGLAAQLSRAIAALHREGVVHRDVKPDNILLRSVDPLAAALADFGISSLLSPGISVKETRAANTPLYSAPESFADFAGEAGDFWSLGAVLLEGALGRHPLAGLSVNQVMREISLRGLPVPPSVPSPEADLLKGLLTRDDRRRWGAAEVGRWLAGERGIEVYYEDPGRGRGPGPGAGASEPGRAPYRFRGREYPSTALLAEAFERSEGDWAQAREHLMRGYVRMHMEESGRSEGARLLARLEGLGLGPDETLFAFIQNFRARARHVWRGVPVSRKGILDLLERRPPGGVPAGGGGAAGPRDAAETFLDEILEGRLSALPDIARKAGNPFDPVIETLFAFGRPVHPWALRSGLEASLDPGAFVWGLRPPLPPGPEPLSFALHAGTPLLTWDRLRATIPRRAALPREIPELLSEPSTYEEGLNSLTLLASSGALRSGVGRDQPDLVPWAASDGWVRLSRATAEDYLDRAEELKEDAARLSPWTGGVLSRHVPGGTGGAGGAGGHGEGKVGDAGGRGEGPGLNLPPGAHEELRRARQWLRAQLGFLRRGSWAALAANILIPGLCVLLVDHYFGGSGLFRPFWTRPHLEVVPPAVMTPLVCLAGAVTASALLVRALSDCLGRRVWLLPPAPVAALLVSAGPALSAVQLTVASILAIYGLMRLRDMILERYAGGGGG
ncbi:MAG: protein kinase [Deltaproteobacteria bacterium]|jgi:hypothetical protein|nr:protein kinase [Deltaproteobacteria bacterium]